MMRVALLAATVCWLVSLASVRAQAPAVTTVWDGAYTTTQADRGRTLYGSYCGGCHGASLEGREGKALAGTAFWNQWREQSVGDLLAYVSKNMPQGAAVGTLSPATYTDIVAHILRANDLPPGQTELTAASGASIRIVAKDGSGELPASALARVVGCLAPRAADGSWHVVKATAPERVTSTDVAAPPGAPLGAREYTLKFVLRSLTGMVGQRVSVTGLLIGEGGADGINVSAVTAIGACE